MAMPKGRALSEEACRFCDEVDAFVEELGPLFMTRERAVVGGALGRLVAAWLEAHEARDEATTADLRKRLFGYHIDYVRQLLVIEHDAFVHWTPDGGFLQ
jgi:hypothetical protein